TYGKRVAMSKRGGGAARGVGCGAGASASDAGASSSRCGTTETRATHDDVTKRPAKSKMRRRPRTTSRNASGHETLRLLARTGTIPTEGHVACVTADRGYVRPLSVPRWRGPGPRPSAPGVTPMQRREITVR